MDGRHQGRSTGPGALGYAGRVAPPWLRHRPGAARPAVRSSRSAARAGHADEAIEEHRVYAVVKAGGRQHKVAVGDRFTVNRLPGQAGDTVTLPALLPVGGDPVTRDP